MLIMIQAAKHNDFPSISSSVTPQNLPPDLLIRNSEVGIRRRWVLFPAVAASDVYDAVER
ncbi:hypothetical protein TIFTF001_010301 [Ficus carica]|uniref:Uncharacterized protein n=1 Tax=Ficus carica TaxID=3494 RepID=A0AA87ZWW4_FICCA|nr:hypothetical protein TIFTF001_010301 [Ficus carica]